MLAQTAVAQNATTVPVGVLSFTFPAGALANPRISTFSLPVRETAPTGFTGKSVGQVTAVSANTLTSAGAGWGASTLAVSGSPHFIRIKNGAGSAGYTFQITANTADTLTVTSPVDLTTLGLVTTVGANQTIYEIFPGDTLLSLFGTGTPTGAGNSVMGGSSASNSDIVRLHDGIGFREYFFHLGNNRWQEGGFARNTVVINPQMGITYMRRASSSLSLAVPGTVPETNLKALVRNSGASYINFPFPVDVTLGTSGIDSMPGWVKADNSAAADNVQVWDGTGWRTYFFHQTNNRWQEGGFNRTSTVIPAGRALWIIKRGVAAGSSYWNFNVPYALN